jgi:hypothetical protein
MDPGVIELFIDGKEDGLPNAGRLHELGLGEGSVVFMLWAGLSWTKHGSGITLSEDGLVATAVANRATICLGRHLVTGGLLMTEGRHYWEVKITADHGGNCSIMLGVARPGLDYDKAHTGYMGTGLNCYYIMGNAGGLFGNGRFQVDPQGMFAQGDRIGMLLDLDAGWLRFYRNGKRCGSGFTEGVTGPLVRAVELVVHGDAGDAVAIVQGAQCPEASKGAGVALL